MRSEINTFNEELKELLIVAGLERETERFRLIFPNELSTVLSVRRAEIGESIRIKKEGIDSNANAPSLDSVDLELKRLDERSLLSETKKREQEKFQKDKRTLEEAIASLQREIKEIDDIHTPRRKRDNEIRMQKFAEYFELLKEEQQQLQTLYRPLQQALLNSNETARRLEFVSRITFNIAAHAANGYDLLDRRKVFREENSLEMALKIFFDAIEQDGFSEARLEEAAMTLLETIRDPKQYSSIKDILRAGKRDSQFADWFFNTDIFCVTYSIKYDGKDLQFLSPGEKGIVLLLLYLEAEQEDNRPLIIDQPDDNLDNLSVYPSLVNYFRKRKKGRQIIIITHNPNLVVNTDAEQVIVANFDGSRSPKIKYRSGALENTQPSGGTGIREDVCKILEGGTEAFQRRERKYDFPNS